MPLSDSSVRSLENQFHLEDYVPNKTILEGRTKISFSLYIFVALNHKSSIFEDNWAESNTKDDRNIMRKFINEHLRLA